jgi:hypothetical protein
MFILIADKKKYNSCHASFITIYLFFHRASTYGTVARSLAALIGLDAKESCFCSYYQNVSHIRSDTLDRTSGTILDRGSRKAKGQG